MNKKFTAFFNGLGMTVNKNSAYGVVNGYETNARLNNFDNVAPLLVHITCYTTDEAKRNIANALRAAAIKFCNFQFSPYGLTVGLNDMTGGRLLKRLNGVLDLLYSTIAANGGLGVGYCPVCGKALEAEQAILCQVDGFTISLDEECKTNLNALIDAENKDFKEAPNNYLRGFLGAVVGALAGVVVAILLNVAGFVSSLSAIVSAVLGAFLYEKFGGKPNKMMIVIVSLTTFVFMAATVPAIYIVTSGIAASEYGVNISMFEAFALLMQDSEFASWFYSDLALILLFSALGVGWIIFYLSRKIKRRQNIQ